MYKYLNTISINIVLKKNDFTKMYFISEETGLQYLVDLVLCLNWTVISGWSEEDILDIFLSFVFCSNFKIYLNNNFKLN